MTNILVDIWNAGLLEISEKIVTFDFKSLEFLNEEQYEEQTKEIIDSACESLKENLENYFSAKRPEL
jgi:hypothetical protein